MMNPEELSRVVHQAWMDWACHQPSDLDWNQPYDDLDERVKEVCRAIGERVMTVAQLNQNIRNPDGMLKEVVAGNLWNEMIRRAKAKRNAKNLLRKFRHTYGESNQPERLDQFHRILNRVTEAHNAYEEIKRIYYGVQV